MAKHHTSPEELDRDKSGVNIFHARDGYYRVEENSIGLFSVKTKYVPDLHGFHEGFIFKLPKIPFKILQQVITFFKSYCRELHNNSLSGTYEAMCQIFWDKGKEEYFIYTPKQEVTSDSIKCERNNNLEKEHILILDIHSHNHMEASFSITDDMDEKETRIYAVVGSMNKFFPDISVRVSCGGNFLNINTNKIFETPFNVQYPDYWNDNVIPLKFAEGDTKQNLKKKSTIFPHKFIDVLKENFNL
ncbi:MAG: hypothetical protein MJA82_00970 [Clostridia bacterium]|nr:hypothetical protein [Clostridia bacterium]